MEAGAEKPAEPVQEVCILKGCSLCLVSAIIAFLLALLYGYGRFHYVQDAGQKFRERKLHMLRETAQMCLELGCEAAVFLIDKDGKFHQFSTSSQPAKQMMRLLACHMDESWTIKDVGAIIAA
jgi:hypothetical protein